MRAAGAAAATAVASREELGDVPWGVTDFDDVALLLADEENRAQVFQHPSWKDAASSKVIQRWRQHSKRDVVATALKKMLKEEGTLQPQRSGWLGRCAVASESLDNAAGQESSSQVEHEANVQRVALLDTLQDLLNVSDDMVKEGFDPLLFELVGHAGTRFYNAHVRWAESEAAAAMNNAEDAEDPFDEGGECRRHAHSWMWSWMGHRANPRQAVYYRLSGKVTQQRRSFLL